MTAQSPAQPDLAAVVDLARHAPSVHNTQPWQFAVAPGVLTLRRDEARRLPVLDPDSRQVTISCGAAVHLARLGLRAQGLDPTAEVVRADSHGIEVRIAAAHRRRAGRGGAGAGDGRPGAAHAARPVRRPGRWRTTSCATCGSRPRPRAPGCGSSSAARNRCRWPCCCAKADELERDDPAYQAELAQWADRPAGSADGLPAAATAPPRVSAASDLTLRRFGSGEPGARQAPAGRRRRGPAGRPRTRWWPSSGPPDDSPQDWLVAGQAMSALLVRATAAGVQASPLGQVLDQPWARRRLAGELGVVGHPQMVLRLGYAEPGPETPRRPVDELLS